MLVQVGKTTKSAGCAAISLAFAWLWTAPASAAPTAAQTEKLHAAAKSLSKAEAAYKSGKIDDAIAAFQSTQDALVELAEDKDLTKQIDPLAKRLAKLHDKMELDGAKPPELAAELTPAKPPAKPSSKASGKSASGKAASGKSASGKSSASAPLGSPAFQPSPERPVGWRGDGSGRYPGAMPPITWERKQTGGDYSTSGILWMAAMPNIGVSSPIIVGDRMFVTSEVSDLVCLDKQSGQILWIRSNPDFEGLPESDRKAEPAYAQNLVPLATQLSALNTQIVPVLNAAMTDPAAAQMLEPMLKGKRELDKKIQDEQLAISKKIFMRDWAQAVFGFSGPTPTSDGKHVCAFFTTGVCVCYDLNGNRKWIARGPGAGSEHGNFASPLLCGNRLVVWANEMRGYDLETGKLMWTNPAKAFNTYGSLFRIRLGAEQVAGFQWGFFTRVRDGQPVWDQGAFGDSVVTPIVEGDFILARTGYPKANDQTAGFKSFRIPASTEEGKVEATTTYNMDWADDELMIDKKRNPFDRGFVASPLFVDGLIYQITQGGGLMVNDAASGEQAYRKVLSLKPRTEYWNWAGCAASPTLAGEYIYLMDNQGTTLVIQPGKKYKEVARNVLEESKDGKEQAQTLASPVFEGSRMYYRTPQFVYCIGKK